jgi:hypothetical protein
VSSASSKAKGRYAERGLAVWLEQAMPDGWHVVRVRSTGSKDEGDVKVLTPDGSPNRTIEVKYRPGSVGKADLWRFRAEAWAEAMHYGSDRALLVVNRPRADVTRWLVHYSTNGELWLIAEVVMLPRLLMIDAEHIRRFSDALQTAPIGELDP